MRKDVQEALENAIAEFEKRQQAEQERLRERERFETEWARIRTAVVLPALEEVAVVLRKAGWQCEVRAGDKDPSVHFTVYRAAKAGVSGGEKPFMTPLLTPNDFASYEAASTTPPQRRWVCRAGTGQVVARLMHRKRRDPHAGWWLLFPS